MSNQLFCPNEEFNTCTFGLKKITLIFGGHIGFLLLDKQKDVTSPYNLGSDGCG